MSKADFFAKSEHVTSNISEPPRPERHIVEVYPYVDESNRLLYEVVRYQPKDFRQRRPDGRGGYSYSLDDTRRVLYRLPDLIEAVALERTVYIAEGERDADNLAALGLTATTNPGGAGKWRDEYGEHLRGAHIIVLPDNDDVGRRHATTLVSALTGIAASVRQIELPGLSPKGDVSDWLAQGHTRAELEELLESSIRRSTCLLNAPPPKPKEFVITPLMARAEFGVLAGIGGGGKSTLALHMAGCVASGHKLFGKYDVIQGPVLYISEEDPIDRIHNRLEAMIVGHRWPREETLRRFHVFALESLSLDDPEWQAWLVQEALRVGAVFIVLDPYFDLTTAQENDNSAQRPVVQYVRRLATETGAAVPIVHHVSKPSEGRARIDRVRGASALRDAARFLYWIEAEEGETAIECLKLTGAEKPKKFIVSRTITTDPDKPGMWKSARFDVVTVKQAAGTKAERFILEQLEGGRRFNTSQIKEGAKGQNISRSPSLQPLQTSKSGVLSTQYQARTGRSFGDPSHLHRDHLRTRLLRTRPRVMTC